MKGYNGCLGKGGRNEAEEKDISRTRHRDKVNQEKYTESERASIYSLGSANATTDI